MPEPLLSIGDRVPLHLDSLAAGGEAVGRYEGLAVFTLWGCPGDDAIVEITEVSLRFARGFVIEVVKPSPDRVKPACGNFRDCGGCQLQHIAYAAQLRHKGVIVRETLARIGGFGDLDVGEVWGMEDPWHYRNRAEYHSGLDARGRFFLGFLRYHSHEVAPGDACRLNHPLIEDLRTAVEDLMSRLAQTAEERADLLRLDAFVSFARGEALPTVICRGRPPYLRALAEELPKQVPAVIGIAAARSRGSTIIHRSPAEMLAGKSRLAEKLGPGEYQVSADSFFQVNPRQAERMLALLQEWAQVDPTTSIVDAYCGVGTFLLPLAREGGPALGIESEDASISDARFNVQRWHLSNVHLQRGRVESVLPRMVREGGHADLIVLDPPRRGCEPAAITAAARFRPRRLLLISCNPATLARDLRALADHGYPPRRIQPIDMFPHTAHVEAVALCEPA